MKIAVLGSGGWGTALSLLLTENGHSVTLRSHTQEECRILQDSGENPLLPGVKLPPSLACTQDLSCVRDCEMVVLATPSFAVGETAAAIRPLLRPDAILVSVSKGIERDTSLRLSEVIARETARRFPVVVLTGPSHAEEVARRVPTAVVAACEDRLMAETVQDAFLNERYFRVYSSPDPVGAELGGALKNIIALCSGCCTGMGLGDNTRAMLMTRGLAEMARLGAAMGARQETFAGLAGMGDLVVTCTSLNSRNYRAGIAIGKGTPVAEAIAGIGAVVEGYFAVDAACRLADKVDVELPITRAAYAVLYENEAPQSVVRKLMGRKKRHELEDSWR